MKIKGYEFPKSSFLSLEKDLGIIVKKLLENNKLKKLLFYQDKNCLLLDDLSVKDSLSLINNQIKIVPKIEIDTNLFTYIVINFNNFIPNKNNSEFRDNSLYFDIFCHFDSWHLSDFELRPYKIGGEIDAMLNGAKLTGIGTLEFVSGEQVVINEDYACVSLQYKIIHGNEDKVD